MSNPITDILWYVNSEVDKLSGVALDRMSEVLDDAQEELTDDLARWSKGLKGDDRFTPAVYRNALIQIRSALAHIAGQHPAIAGVLKYGANNASAMALRHLQEEAAKFSSVFEGVVRPVAIEAATVIGTGQRLLWPTYAKSAARYAGQVGDDIRRQLSIGVIRGESIDQLTSRLARLGGPVGLVDMGRRHELISEGLFKRYRSWGERLARTEVVNAYNVFTHLGIEDIADGEDGYLKRWDAAIDGRLCPLCREMDDQIVGIDQLFKGGFKHPPRHPNCRCAVVLWRKEWGAVDHGDTLRVGKAPDTSVIKIHTPEPPAVKPVKPVKPKLTPEQKAEKLAALAFKKAEKLAAKQAKADALIAKAAEKQAKKDQKAAELAARKSAREAKKFAKKTGKLPANQIVKLPAPQPSWYTNQQRADYMKEAMSGITLSREEWSFSSAREWASDNEVKPGMTYSKNNFRAIRAKFAKTLSKEELDAALFYSHQGDRVLNAAFREQIVDRVAGTQDMADTLDRVIDKHRMTKDTYVARGIKGPWAQQFGNLLKPGDVFEEPGYTSTAATSPFSGAVKIRIRIPKGAAAAPIPSRYFNEDEFLLPRGTQFHVVSVSKSEFPDRYGEHTFEMELEVVQ